VATHFPGAQAWLPDRLDKRSLTEAAQECQGCELYADATQTVFGAGPARARFMLVGEQPGDAEDKAGQPFVGPAGRLLHEALDAAGVASDAVYLTNAVKHFRWKPARDSKRRIHERPGTAHITACNPWLRAELRWLQPSVVLLLGAVAGQAVFGSGFAVTKHRGAALDWPAGFDFASSTPPRLFVTIHPSAVLRATGSADRASMREGLVADLRLALISDSR
jgi:uracil-DNA glycosylase family protein